MSVILLISMLTTVQSRGFNVSLRNQPTTRSGSIILVALNETRRLECFTCLDPVGALASRQSWYRVPLEGSIEQLQEIIFGTMDPAVKHNHTVDEDNSFFIFNTSKRDAGLYFCGSPNITRKKGISKITVYQLFRQYSKDIHSLYYLDVHNSPVIPVKMNETYDGYEGPPTCTPPYDKLYAQCNEENVVFPDQNIQATRRWRGWSRCNRCGGKGLSVNERTCLVQAIDHSKETLSVISDYYLRGLFSEGIPCTSSFIPSRLKAAINEISDQVVYKTCKIACPGGDPWVWDRQQQLTLNEQLRKAMVYSSIYRSAIETDVGANVSIGCHRMPSEARHWKRGRKTLIMNTIRTQKMLVDKNSNLIIFNISTEERGSYTCWSWDNLLLSKTEIEVIEPPALEEAEVSIHYLAVVGSWFVFLAIGGAAIMKKREFGVKD